MFYSELGSEDNIVAPGVAVDNGHAAISLGDFKCRHFAPTGWTIVKRLARKYDAAAHIVKLIESAAQAVLVGHEQVTMQGHHAHSQVTATGNDKLGMFHQASPITAISGQ